MTATSEIFACSTLDIKLTSIFHFLKRITYIHTNESWLSKENKCTCNKLKTLEADAITVHYLH